MSTREVNWHERMSSSDVAAIPARGLAV